MPAPRLRYVRRFAMATVSRSMLAMLASQMLVIAGIATVDAVQKRKRSKRTGFPRPGTFENSVAGTSTTVFTYGEDLYDAMLDALAGAEHEILFETYIWKGDALGRRFRDAINEAAARGVAVHVIFDGFANLVVPRSFYAFHPSVQVFRFPVFRPSILFTNIRGSGFDHRKLLVVDDTVAFVGGYNIGSLYAATWRDTHLALRGPAIWDLRQAFASVWNLRRGPNREPLAVTGTSSWEPSIRTVNNIPANLVFPVRGIYLDAINRARHHIYLTTAYFIPDRQILEALIRASERGVDVRVLVPEYSNHVVSDWLSRGFYTSLLKAGVTVLLFQNAMIHAKTATVDGEWSTVGTANIDRLSLTGNYEINLEIFDERLADTMEQVFAIDSTNSRTLTLEEWEDRHIVAQVSETILRPLRPFL